MGDNGRFCPQPPNTFTAPCASPTTPKTIAKNRSANPRQADVLGNHTNGHARLHPQGARQGNVLRISSSGDQGRPRVKGAHFPASWLSDLFCSTRARATA
jgi:hypothetical protein